MCKLKKAVCKTIHHTSKYTTNLKINFKIIRGRIQAEDLSSLLPQCHVHLILLYSGCRIYYQYLFHIQYSDKTTLLHNHLCQNEVDGCLIV